MADEAFALSPISARAAQPSDEDYAAISEAFMETSRGRWFLTEYAKRNRNADTRMVLDAVARIEQSLAAQKEDGLAAQREAAAAAAAVDAGHNEAMLAEARLAAAQLAEARLAEIMAAIRGAVETAQASAVEALDGLALNEQLAPIRKGGRVLREIAWRLREIGNDGRICDLIDSQVGVIEKGAEQISADQAKAALSAAFAALEGRLAEFSAQETPPPITEPEPAAPAPAPQDAPVAEAAHAAALHEEVSTAFVAEPIEPEPVPDVAQVSTGVASTDAVAEAPLAQDEIGLEAAEAIELTPEAADAHDEAVLDMIAMEMGIPDPIDDAEFAPPAVEAAHFPEPPPVEPEIAAEMPEPVAAPAEPPPQLAPQPVVAETASEPAREISLGSSIIASGIVRKPMVAANDPLAPIRRMSQVEKIAFFS